MTVSALKERLEIFVDSFGISYRTDTLTVDRLYAYAVQIAPHTHFTVVQYAVAVVANEYFIGEEDYEDDEY